MGGLPGAALLHRTRARQAGRRHRRPWQPRRNREILHRIAAGLQVPCALDGDHTRVWLTDHAATYPRLKEFFVAAPDSVRPKQRAGFEARWHGHADDLLLALEHTAHAAVTVRDAA